MHKDNLDQKITDRLKMETNDVTNLKDMTWHNINKALLNHELKTKQNRKRRFITVIAMAFLIAITWAGLSTPIGQALIQNIKDLFVEEKDVELNIEGEKEITHTELEVNEELRYVIYVDTSRYKLIKGETTDKIVTKEEIPSKYPEVSMEIIHQEETTMEDTANKIRQQIQNLDMDIIIDEETDIPFTSTVIFAIGKGYTNEWGKTGVQWDTPIHKYYVTEDEAGQLFIVKQMYFQEAAEGHGVRFDSMLESFEIVK